MRTNTKNFGIYIKQGATLPVTPANFVEVDEKILLTPNVTVENFKRFNGKLGANDSYADTCNTAVEGVSVSHKMRFQNGAADALDTIPDYGELLKVSGFTQTIDATPAAENVIYTWDTSASPALGSATYFIDGNKQTMTNTIAGNAVFTFEIGKSAMLNFAMSGFLDNKGISSTATLVLSAVVGLAVGDVLTGDTSSASGTVLAINGTSVSLKSVTGTFEVAGEALNTAAYTSTSATQGNPTTTLSDEGCLIVGCADIYTEDGTQLNPTNISIDMGSQINKFYGMGLKEYQLTDFEPKITTDFYLDNADYNDAMNKLVDQSYVNVVIKLGTLNGAEVNGKTVLFTINNVKFSTFSDADDQDTIKRTHELMLTATSSFTIKHGFYA